MSPYHLLFLLLLFSSFGFFWGQKKALAVSIKSGGIKSLHSRPVHYGVLTLLWCLIPALLIFCFWLAFESKLITALVLEGLPENLQQIPKERLGLLLNDIKNLVHGNITSFSVSPEMERAAAHYLHLQGISHKFLALCATLVSLGGLLWMKFKIKPSFRARNHLEKFINIILIFCSCLAILTTIGIVMSVLYEAIAFFKVISIREFLFGLKWSPQMAMRSDQVGSSGAFGAIPVFWGTIMISGIAMTVAVPVGLMSAIYLSEYANRRFRAVAKPLLEILAGIPTVVYGFFAVLLVAPAIRNFGASMGFDIASESALAAGFVMGIMIIPFVSSLSDDVINAVPQSLRDGALGLGSTQSETIQKVVLPAALPGIVGGILLAVSRAIGETMIVVMAAGLSANMTMNPLASVTTVTVQIVTLLAGDQEFDSPKTLAAFALGLMLFLVTLILNVIALLVVRKYREQYE